jgi:hydrogenase maturation protease
MSTPHDVVVGLGNPLRRDDGVGPAVADLVAHRALPRVTVERLTGDDPTVLLDAWRGARQVVVVEAVRCPGCTPGAIHRIEPASLGSARTAASSHGVDLATTYLLGGIVGCRPERLVVVGVQVVDTAVGRGLSPAVEAVLPDVAAHVLVELAAGDAAWPICRSTWAGCSRNP